MNSRTPQNKLHKGNLVWPKIILIVVLAIIFIVGVSYVVWRIFFSQSNNVEVIEWGESAYDGTYFDTDSQHTSEESLNGFLIKNYDEYQNYTPEFEYSSSTPLTRGDFKKNDYLAVSMIAGCDYEIKKLKSIYTTGNVLNAEVEIEKKNGVCKPVEVLYLFPIEKNIYNNVQKINVKKS